MSAGGLWDSLSTLAAPHGSVTGGRHVRSGAVQGQNHIIVIHFIV